MAEIEESDYSKLCKWILNTERNWTIIIIFTIAISIAQVMHIVYKIGPIILTFFLMLAQTAILIIGWLYFLKNRECRLKWIKKLNLEYK